jgi:photosystem II stability/assembly factor-like uncharacterized protein
MKIIISSVLIISLILIIPINAQWNQTKGPTGGTITGLFQAGTKIFAFTGNADHLYASTDVGHTWGRVTTGWPNTNINTLAYNNLYLLCGTNNGFYRSNDIGDTWTKLSPTGFGNHSVSCLAYDGQFYASTPDSGVFISSTNGESWNSISAGLTTLTVGKLYTLGGKLFANNSSALQMSTDHGNHWLYTNQYNCQDMALRPDNAFLATRHEQYLQVSADGSSWSTLSYLNYNFLALLTVGSDVYTGTNVGVYKSTDGGAHFSAFNTGMQNEVTDLIETSEGMMASTYGTGIFTSPTGGATWVDRNNGIINTHIYSICGDSNVLLAGSATDGIFRTTDNGDTWVKKNTGLESSCIYVMKNLGNSIIAGTSNGIYYTDNLGDSWSHFKGTMNGIVSSFYPGSQYYFCAATHLYKSGPSDTGWTRIKQASLGISAVYLSGDVLLASDYALIYRSTDYGGTWTDVSIPYSSLVQDIKGQKSYFLAATKMGGLCKTTDNGSSWVKVFTGNAQKILLADSIIFMVANNSVFYSRDDGDTWTEYNNGMGSNAVYNIYILNNTLYAATDGDGVWKASLSNIVSVDKKGELKNTGYELKQNYPNPWNPTTTINYALGKGGHVKLTIYNALGSKVTTIVDENKPAGSYSIQFNGSNLASGIYLYRLESGSYSAAKKFILIK